MGDGNWGGCGEYARPLAWSRARYMGVTFIGGVKYHLRHGGAEENEGPRGSLSTLVQQAVLSCSVSRADPCLDS